MEKFPTGSLSWNSGGLCESNSSGGVQLARCQPNSDFGLGFYTTTHREQAWEFADKKVVRKGGAPAVLRFEVNRIELSALRTNAFVTGEMADVDFWSLVSGCRGRFPYFYPAGTEFEVAFGPVARWWWGPAKSQVYAGYDQVSFHTSNAIEVLSRIVPTRDAP